MTCEHCNKAPAVGLVVTVLSVGAPKALCHACGLDLQKREEAAGRKVAIETMATEPMTYPFEV